MRNVLISSVRRSTPGGARVASHESGRERAWQRPSLTNSEWRDRVDVFDVGAHSTAVE